MLSEELGSLKTGKKKPSGNDISSSRSSLEYSRSNRRLASPSGTPASSSKQSSAPSINGSASSRHGAIDYVYLKNVLLQFLEQKDKKHQLQLIPVLAMLLHFDQ